MTDEQADELAREADRVGVGFWMAVDGWLAGREKASQWPGGPEVFAKAVVGAFEEQMADRRRTTGELRSVLAQVAGMGLDFLSPGASRAVDLSGAKPSSAPLENPYRQIAGPSLERTT